MTDTGVLLRDPPALRARIFVRRKRLHLQRVALKRAARRGGVDEPPVRPVFVIGCPRSGTTLLFRLLRGHPGLRALPGEGHLFWATYQHPRDKGWGSDRATAEDVIPGEPRLIYTGISRVGGTGRFLDKTPRNSLKIPYLASLFPDATFVLLKRDGRPTVSSLIEGWTVRHGVSYTLPEPLHLKEYRGRLWSYVLPPGWREWASTSVAEVAAFQYVSCYETALGDLAVLPKERVVSLGFEELLSDPQGAMVALLDRLSLQIDRGVMEMASNLDRHPVQTNSPPREGKWKERMHLLEPVLDRITPTMRRLGYEVEVDA